MATFGLCSFAQPSFVISTGAQCREESLHTPDFRKAVHASVLLSFRPERSAVEKSLGAPEFREAIRA
jgi:hypothetical protein